MLHHCAPPKNCPLLNTHVRVWAHTYAQWFCVFLFFQKSLCTALFLSVGFQVTHSLMCTHVCTKEHAHCIPGWKTMWKEFFNERLRDSAVAAGHVMMMLWWWWELTVYLPSRNVAPKTTRVLPWKTMHSDRNQLCPKIESSVCTDVLLSHKGWDK